MSGGEQQRVAIARALATHPVLVLADEPTANLDTENGNQVMEIMERLNEETGTTFIFATHDPRVIPYARRTIELRDGRISDSWAISPQMTGDPEPLVDRAFDVGGVRRG
jgi:putative ABC transport system ATP-binding protein